MRAIVPSSCLRWSAAVGLFLGVFCFCPSPASAGDQITLELGETKSLRIPVVLSSSHKYKLMSVQIHPRCKQFEYQTKDHSVKYRFAEGAPFGTYRAQVRYRHTWRENRRTRTKIEEKSFQLVLCPSAPDELWVPAGGTIGYTLPPNITAASFSVGGSFATGEIEAGRLVLAGVKPTKTRQKAKLQFNFARNPAPKPLKMYIPFVVVENAPKIEESIILGDVVRMSSPELRKQLGVKKGGFIGRSPRKDVLLNPHEFTFQPTKPGWYGFALGFAGKKRKAFQAEVQVRVAVDLVDAHAAAGEHAPLLLGVQLPPAVRQKPIEVRIRGDWKDDIDRWLLPSGMKHRVEEGVAKVTFPTADAFARAQRGIFLLPGTTETPRAMIVECVLEGYPTLRQEIMVTKTGGGFRRPPGGAPGGGSPDEDEEDPLDD